MKLQLIELASIEAEADFGAEEEGQKIFVLNLPIALVNRSAVLASILAETEEVVSTLKASLSAKEVERVSALCKLQSARESTSNSANDASEGDLDFEN